MFDLQRFGTNDTVTSANALQFNFGFVDGDTRTINYPNPRPDLTEQDIATFDTYIINGQYLIGDKAGASSTGVNTATIIETTRVKLDISNSGD